MRFEYRVLEVDFEIDLEAFIGSELSPLVAVFYTHLFTDTNKFLGGGLFNNTGRLQQEYKWCCQWCSN